MNKFQMLESQLNFAQDPFKNLWNLKMRTFIDSYIAHSLYHIIIWPKPAIFNVKLSNLRLIYSNFLGLSGPIAIISRDIAHSP